MNTIHRVLIVGISLSLISCQTDQIVHDAKSIPTPLVDLSTTLQAADSVDYTAMSPPFAPSGILNVNDRYLVEHQQTSSNFFRVLKLPELTYLYTWGLEGRGPGEYTMFPLFFNVIHDENLILSYDIIDIKQDQFQVHDSTIRYVQSNTFFYEGRSEVLEVVANIGKDKYIVDHIPNSEDDNAEFVLIESGNTKPLLQFGEYPNSDADRYNKPLRFKKTGASNITEQRFASFYMRHNSFKIFDFQGELIGHYKVDGFEYVYAVMAISDPILSRIVAYSTDELIYTVGYGMLMSEFYTGNYPSTFEVWNWDGESVYRAKFDRLIYGFTVSEVHGKIYGFTQQNPEKIYIYDLPTIQK